MGEVVGWLFDCVWVVDWLIGWLGGAGRGWAGLGGDKAGWRVVGFGSTGLWF